MWTLVEQLHQRGHTKLYTGWPPDAWQVRRAAAAAAAAALHRRAPFPVACGRAPLLPQPFTPTYIHTQKHRARLPPRLPRVQALYMLLTVVALDYLHDAWFYWTHRLLHWRPLYVHVHAPHHT